MSSRTLTALPVFNEETHIAEVLKPVKKYSEAVLVVDDGSTDSTADRLEGISGIDVLRHEKNLGYGAALRSAFEYASAEGFDVLVTIDCDGQHEPRLIPEILEAVCLDSEFPYDIVSGSRYLKAFEGDSQPPVERRDINLTITDRLNRELGLSLTDSFCGFKAYRTEALRQLNITELGYAMPLQLWVQAVRLDLRIVEFAVPLVYLEEERSFGGSLDDSRRRLAYYEQVLDREMANPAPQEKAGSRPCCAG